MPECSRRGRHLRRGGRCAVARGKSAVVSAFAAVGSAIAANTADRAFRTIFSTTLGAISAIVARLALRILLRAFLRTGIVGLLRVVGRGVGQMVGQVVGQVVGRVVGRMVGEMVGAVVGPAIDCGRVTRLRLIARTGWGGELVAGGVELILAGLLVGGGSIALGTRRRLAQAVTFRRSLRLPSEVAQKIPEARALGLLQQRG